MKKILKKEKILIVSSCTKDKLYNPNNKLTLEDFKNLEKLKIRKDELNVYKTKAYKMYTGYEHLNILKNIEAINKKYGSIIEHYILSSGYGLLHRDDFIVPYDVTFNTMTDDEINEWSDYLNIHNSLNKIIKDYKYVIFILPKKYLQSLKLPLNNVDKAALYFVLEKEDKNQIPNIDNYNFVYVNNVIYDVENLLIKIVDKIMGGNIYE